MEHHPKCPSWETTKSPCLCELLYEIDEARLNLISAKRQSQDFQHLEDSARNRLHELLNEAHIPLEELEECNRCKACVFWDPKADDLNSGFGRCKSKKFVDESSKDFHGRIEDEETGDYVTITLDMLLYSDVEGYAASMQTGPDFGCIHWRSK